MPNLNQVILAGNLTRTPELMTFGSGATKTDLSVAINRKYKDRSGNPIEETTYVDVECWHQTAEFCCSYLTKGCGVLIEGYLKLDQWEDSITGQKRQKLKVAARTVQSTSRPSAPGNPQQEPNYAPPSQNYQQAPSAPTTYQQPQAPQSPPPPQVQTPPPFPVDEALQPGDAESPAYDASGEGLDDIPF